MLRGTPGQTHSHRMVSPGHPQKGRRGVREKLPHLLSAGEIRDAFPKEKIVARSNTHALQKTALHRDAESISNLRNIFRLATSVRMVSWREHRGDVYGVESAHDKKAGPMTVHGPLVFTSVEPSLESGAQSRNHRKISFVGIEFGERFPNSKITRADSMSASSLSALRRKGSFLSSSKRDDFRRPVGTTGAQKERLKLLRRLQRILLHASVSSATHHMPRYNALLRELSIASLGMTQLWTSMIFFVHFF